MYDCLQEKSQNKGVCVNIHHRHEINKMQINLIFQKNQCIVEISMKNHVLSFSNMM